MASSAIVPKSALALIKIFVRKDIVFRKSKNRFKICQKINIFGIFQIALLRGPERYSFWDHFSKYPYIRDHQNLRKSCFWLIFFVDFAIFWDFGGLTYKGTLKSGPKRSTAQVLSAVRFVKFRKWYFFCQNFNLFLLFLKTISFRINIFISASADSEVIPLGTIY